jgi:hypothetical protein
MWELNMHFWLNLVNTIPPSIVVKQFYNCFYSPTSLSGSADRLKFYEKHEANCDISFVTAFAMPKESGAKP